MEHKTSLRLFALFICLLMMGTVVSFSIAEATSYTITTQVTAGQGWIDTVESSAAVPVGTTKHFRIKPARDQMISDVQIDGQSIGPMMYATIPWVTSNHTVSVSFEPFDQLKASNISTKLTNDARILLIGESQSIQKIKTYLDGQIAADGGLGFNVTIGTQAISQDLLWEYYSNRTGPGSKNDLLNKIAEGWDYIVPLDLYDYPALLPELHFEGIRLIYNRAWFDAQARLILPMLWFDTQSSLHLDKLADHTYRIGNTFRVPVLPVGYAWQKMVAEQGQPESPVEFMSNSAAYLFASMLFAQLFEKNVADVGYFPPDLSGTVKSTIEDVVWSTWQTEKTKSHYMGAYAGVSTPFAFNGGRGYLFGTSTRVRSVGKMNELIANHDPVIGNLAFDSADGFGEAADSGSTVQNNLSSRTYTYMWRQRKGEDTDTVLDTYVRGQFNQDPYFIWFTRYMDATADVNARNIGLAAFYEVTDAYDDNTDTANNPNQKSRAPQTHIGWGRIWEERTDIQMMEDLSENPAHAHDVLMSMFAAQTYALLTGRDASLFGTWGYDPNTQPDLVEKSGYARRVGYETIMQLGRLDIHEPYDRSDYDIPVFNQNSVFYPERAALAAGDNVYLVEQNQTLSVPAPGVLADDYSADLKSLTAIIKSQPDNGSVNLNSDGSFVYTPPPDFQGSVTFTYAAFDGEKESNLATVTILVSETLYYIYLPVVTRN